METFADTTKRCSLSTVRLKTTHACVVDFEATCWEDKPAPGEPVRANEIIEIGAVMVDLRSMKVTSDFCSFVRPVVNPVLSEFCTGLTSITQADVDGAPDFPVAIEKWNSWLESCSDIGTVLFSSWGLYDYKQLSKDCAYHAVPFPFRGDHLNLKEYVAAKMGWSRRGCGMGKAMGRLGIKFEGRPHRGIDDAKMAARVLAKVGLKDMAIAGYRTSGYEVFKGYPGD